MASTNSVYIKNVNVPVGEIAFGSNTNSITSVPYFGIDNYVFSLIFPTNNIGIQVNDALSRTSIFGSRAVGDPNITFTGTGLNDLNTISIPNQAVTLIVTIDGVAILTDLSITSVTDTASFGDTIIGTNTGATGIVYLIITDDDNNIHYYLTPLTGDFTGETDFTNSTNPSNFGTCGDIVTDVDTYSWYTDDDSNTGIPCTTYTFGLVNHIAIFFGNLTGHTLGDSWSIVYSNIYGRLANFQFGNSTNINIGDVDALLNGGLFYLLQHAKGSIGVRSAIIDNNGSYLYVDSDSFIYQLGDIDNANNGCYIEVDDNNEVINLRVNNHRVGVFAGDPISVSIGDYDNVGNSTRISIDDDNELITISNVPTFANDSDAIGGGLQPGNLYKTTTLGITALNIVP